MVIYLKLSNIVHDELAPSLAFWRYVKYWLTQTEDGEPQNFDRESHILTVSRNSNSARMYIHCKTQGRT